MVEKIPETQKAFCLLSTKGETETIEIPVPKPGPGQVLIKVECAPINPSDTYFMGGQFSLYTDDPEKKIKFPFAGGWEGSGRVVASGGGLMAWRLGGKRVAFSRGGDKPGYYTNGGAFEQYCVVPAVSAVPLPDQVSSEVGSMSFVNPLTALGLVDLAQNKHKSVGIVQTGAASQLGRMVVKICKDRKVPLINIVRREEQVTLLKELGAEHVINSSTEGWEKELFDLSRKINATCAFECVAGETAGKVINQMPFGSTIILYGSLSQTDVGAINPLLMVARDTRLVTFFLPLYLKSKGVFAQMGLIGQMQKLMVQGTVASEIAERVNIDDVSGAIERYNKNMTAGKFILFPNGVPQEDQK